MITLNNILVVQVIDYKHI